MIIERYLLKEISFNFLAVLAIILLIFGGHHFVRFMESAASGGIPTDYIFKLLSVFILSQLMLLVPGALFIAFLITLGRLYRDYEVTALFSCGVSLSYLMRPLLVFALLSSVLVALLSIWVAPWAERTTYEMRQEARLVAEYQAFASGQFHRIGKNKGVFYIEQAEEGGKFERVFVFLEAQRGMEVFSAVSGQRLQNNQGDFLVLDDGSLLRSPTSQDSWAMLEYRQAQIQLQPPERQLGNFRTREKPMGDLLASDERGDFAEVYWRLSVPVASFLLLVFAIFLSKSDPRQGRFGKLFIAILLYIFYIYGMIMAKNWLRSEEFPLLLGVLWLHLIFLIAIVVTGWQQLALGKSARSSA